MSEQRAELSHFDLVQKLRAELADAERAVKLCSHIWTYAAGQEVYEHLIDHGESMGTSRVYALRERRHCKFCGTREIRYSAIPGEWSNWTS